MMDIYKEVNVLNEDVKETTGRNLAPMVQYIVDENIKEIPRRKTNVPLKSAPPPMIHKSNIPAPVEKPPQIIAEKVIEKVPVEKHMNIVKQVNSRQEVISPAPQGKMQAV